MEFLRTEVRLILGPCLFKNQSLGFRFILLLFDFPLRGLFDIQPDSLDDRCLSQDIEPF